MRLCFLSFTGILFLVSCQSEQTDSEKIEDSVRNYFFLADTAVVIADITDTLTVQLVDEMLDNVEKNLLLVRQDLEKLSALIDTHSYRLLQHGDSLAGIPDSLLPIQIAIYTMQLKQGKIESKEQEYIQTGRMLKRLKRKAWADVGGFSVAVSFFENGEFREEEVLMDGEFTIVD